MRRTGRPGSGRGETGGGRALVAAVLIALSLMVIDARGGEASVLRPLRTLVGAGVGPVEAAADAVARPFRDLASAVHTNSRLRRDVATLQAQKTRLEGQLRTTGLDRNRLAEYDGLTRTARDTGYAMVPARVVGVGPAQSFSRTVTIDAGSAAGLTVDSTVVNGDGLVGRVVQVSRGTATVLLIVDSGSVVGGRLGASMKIGFVRGRGGFGDRSRLDLELVDNEATPARGDVAVSWGSARGGPYVAGIPIGKVTRVYTSPRELSKRAVLDPFVDFGSLDLVGVIVPTDTVSDRALVRPTGRIR